MRTHAVGAGLLACVLMAACSPTAQNARPSGTLEPSITESSKEPTARPPSSKACKLLTSEERSDMVRMSMDAELPVRPVAGTEECIWTHSSNEPARSAIRVIAADGPAWAQVARPQIVLAINHPSTSKSLARELRQALADLSVPIDELTDERICETYLLFTESRGMRRSEDMLFVGTIGAMPAVYAASCEGGTIVMAGFGEYGLRGSIALNHAVFRLVDAANDRVDGLFSDAAGSDARTNETGEQDAAADDSSPGSEPSPTEDGDSGSDANPSDS